MSRLITLLANILTQNDITSYSYLTDGLVNTANEYQ